jgi:hypothetical protein
MTARRCVGSVALIILLISFAGAAHAVGWDTWFGKWFKVTARTSGYDWADPGMERDSGTQTLYVKVVSWEQNYSLLHCRVVDAATLGAFDMPLHYVTGQTFDFLAESAVDFGTSWFGFAARIQGNLVKGSLKSATFKTLGGFYADRYWAEPPLAAGGMTWTGTLIAEEKVPLSVRDAAW